LGQLQELKEILKQKNSVENPFIGNASIRFLHHRHGFFIVSYVYNHKLQKSFFWKSANVAEATIIFQRLSIRGMTFFCRSGNM
jgi:hypothetical protein